MGGVLTGWAISNVALVVNAVLSELVGWPLLVTPHATEIKPAGAILRLGSGAINLSG